MADENPNEHPPSKIHRAISIVIPLLPIVLLILFAVFDSEFRKYITETAYDGFYLAKEGFEMLEFMAIVLCGIVIFGVFYAFNVLKIKKITGKHQEKIIQFINDEKSLILLGMVMLLLCILVYAPYQEYKNDQATINKLKMQLTNKKSKPAESKPLPDKIIPAPEPPLTSIASAKQPINVESQTKFETNAADIGDIESELAKSKADKLTHIQEFESKAQASWTNGLSVYNYSLKALYDILTEEKNKHGDRIVITDGYFQCLPSMIDPKISVPSVAEIRFETKTNLDFKIEITPEQWVGDQMLIPRGLKISCKSGFLLLRNHPYGNDDTFLIQIQIPDISDLKSSSIQAAPELVKHYLKILVAGQIEYLKNANE